MVAPCIRFSKYLCKSMKIQHDFLIVLDPFWDPSWSLLGGQNRPKMGQVGLKTALETIFFEKGAFSRNPLKINENANSNRENREFRRKTHKQQTVTENTELEHSATLTWRMHLDKAGLRRNAHARTISESLGGTGRPCRGEFERILRRKSPRCKNQRFASTRRTLSRP